MKLDNFPDRDRFLFFIGIFVLDHKHHILKIPSFLPKTSENSCISQLFMVTLRSNFKQDKTFQAR